MAKMNAINPKRPTLKAGAPPRKPEINPNSDLLLIDWNGVPLKGYTLEETLALDSLPIESGVTHELLQFQGWNWELDDIKSWIQNYKGHQLIVGAIYTTTDGGNHNYWNNPRLTNAKSIYMQKRGVTSISSNAFQNCLSLTAINIPDGVTSIGSYAFQSCYSLTAINIPDGVTSIGSYAFQSCYSLTAINIPDGVTSIGSYAFQYCYSLTAINIPDGVTLIDNSAFQYCTSLTTINIPDGVTSIGINAFQYCYSLTAINIPDGVTLIDNSAFAYCTSLTAINIPDGVTSIGSYAFYNCFSLTAINIPDGVTSIGNSAFQYCTSLTAINIPDGVTSIGINAFRSCRELYDVVIHGKPALSNTNAFGDAPSTQKLYVHRSDLSWFETETNWSTIYAQGKIVAAADYLDYLRNVGIDVTDFEDE